jgi:hypothetical protein
MSSAGQGFATLSGSSNACQLMTASFVIAATRHDTRPGIPCP